VVKRSSSSASTREVETERELQVLRKQMAQKDDEIANMEQNFHSLNTALSNSNEEMESKEQSIAALTAELEKIKSIAMKPTSSRVLEMSRDQAENVDMMRSQIVSLAQALETSESRRAEVIEKIETERQAHAESLRLMTVNMKRFYSTLNMSDDV